MNIVPGNLRSLSAAANPAESDTAHLVARARVMMMISVLTTLLAIAAVVVVIGYRVYARGGVASDSTLVLPKGARVVSTLATATTISLTLEIDGKTEVRFYDRKTLQPTGRLHFGTEP
jgi:hypothetical protein